jgi:hypothetical protein
MPDETDTITGVGSLGADQNTKLTISQVTVTETRQAPAAARLPPPARLLLLEPPRSDDPQAPPVP